jgi:MFS family permease
MDALTATSVVRPRYVHARAYVDVTTLLQVGYFASIGTVLVFGLGTAFVDHFYLVLAFRFMVGFGVAGSHVAVTIFAEFLPSRLRSLFVCLAEGFWAAGAITAAGLAWAVLPNFEVDMGWRVLVGISSLPLVAISFMWGWLPESPRFNLVKGRPERIEPVFKRAYRINGLPYPSHRKLSTKLAAGDFDDLNTKRGTCLDLFADPLMCVAAGMVGEEPTVDGEATVRQWW